jgi:1-acyl-sn-glycerol-3-phosphate acyltransferase
MAFLSSLFRLTVGFIVVAVGSVLTICVLVPLLPWRVARIKVCNVYGKVVGQAIVRIAGVRPLFSHRERLDAAMPAIYVMNHTSALDAFLGIWMCPMGGCGVFKKQIVQVPFFGQLAWLSGHLLLDRANHQSAVESLRQTADLMKQHRLGVWIMPEGTRSKDGRLLAFKKGFVHLAIATGFPVVPVVVHGAHRNWKNGSFLEFVPMDMDIEVLAPIDSSTWKEETAGDHAQAVHDLMAARLRDDQKPVALPVAAVAA